MLAAWVERQLKDEKWHTYWASFRWQSVGQCSEAAWKHSLPSTGLPKRKCQMAPCYLKGEGAECGESEFNRKKRLKGGCAFGALLQAAKCHGPAMSTPIPFVIRKHMGVGRVIFIYRFTLSCIQNSCIQLITVYKTYKWKSMFSLSLISLSMARAACPELNATPHTASFLHEDHLLHGETALCLMHFAPINVSWPECMWRNRISVSSALRRCMPDPPQKGHPCMRD